MTQAFDQLIPETQDFCRRLAQNNNRDWYQVHKDEYQNRLKIPATHLIDEIRPKLAQMAGAETSGKLFRINRDLRFAKGKPPYKDFLHMLWYSHTNSPAQIGWFFGIEKDRLRIGAGFMGFEGDALTAWRQAIDGPSGADIARDIAAQLTQGAEPRGEPQLKRIPAPHAKDHPRGELLRRKSFTLWRDMTSPKTNLPQAIMTEFERLAPCFLRIHQAMH